MFCLQKNLANKGGSQTITLTKGPGGVTWVKMTVESLHNLKNPKQFGVRALRLYGKSGPVAKPTKPGEQEKHQL